MLDFELNFAPDAVDSARVPFCGSLGVASFDGQSQPGRESFESVEGFNLSHTGISFTTPRWPVTDRLMVALGDERSPVLVSARVVACRKPANSNEEAPFEVLCQFDQWYT